MTGQGRGVWGKKGYQFAAEITSVNRKQGDVVVNLPRDLEALEGRVRDEVHRRCARGRLSVRITVGMTDGVAPGQVRLNRPLARAYHAELTRLAKELGMTEPLSMDAILRAPGVFQAEEQSTDAEPFWQGVRRALDGALNELVAMREREGLHLARDLRQRIQKMRRALTVIRRRAPKVLEQYRSQLRDRVRAAGIELGAEDEDRLMKEIVLFADRSDISEELARLASHFEQFDHCAQSSEPVGRTLDFLAQEMNREINTIGSKANDGQIAHQVVVLKTELEKFREQAQNVE